MEYPNPVLRQVTPEVVKVDSELVEQIEELTKMLQATENTAAGLAATQIGFISRFFGLKEGSGKKVDVFINPKIVQTFGKKSYPMMVFEDGKQENFLEGCLSFPNLFGIVERWLKVEVSWDVIKDGKLENQKKIMEGFEAIVFQHEAEHLDGILFVDHIKEKGGKLYKFEGEKKKLIDVKQILSQ